jgi:hypothetical protein
MMQVQTLTAVITHLLSTVATAVSELDQLIFLLVALEGVIVYSI